MDVQTEVDVTAAIRKVDGNHDLGAAQLAEDLLAELANQGYAVVKLPERVADRGRADRVREVWQADSRDKYPAEVEIGEDGRIRMIAISNPIASPEHALSLAAALIAAAQHMQEQTDG